ncbi:MAG: Na(+)-translocating NADH-quinone reductase subunit C [Flavobacteriaceae bacterium]|jgi:Na+-transporting NADH:ubiquinone oxidoreductase subunit C
MNRDSNLYTFIFAAVMVFVVASVLAFTATSLKDLQAENVRLEKMQNILATIGIETDREKAEGLYKQYVVEELALKNDGSVDATVNAFEVKLNTELKKGISEQRFPLYVAKVAEETFYIVPLRGAGLWDAIWGYIALQEDNNTIKGAVFDHKGETAGLGAEITQKWFQDRFIGEKILAQDGSLKGIAVSKTNNDPNGMDKEDHEVDAISGATITGDGVTDMIIERLTHYMPYFQNQRPSMALN